MNKAKQVQIAGVDEAGRGPLAGPVYAAAVILEENKIIDGLNDSKQLTELKREALFEAIQANALSYSIARAEVEEIDAWNIHFASLLAMQRAVDGLSVRPGHLLVDGKHCPKLGICSTAIVKGDAKVPAISAASILAKVARDREMMALDQQYPGYGFAEHKGYGTKTHIAALKKLGVSQVHRRSFAVIRELLGLTSGWQEALFPMDSGSK